MNRCVDRFSVYNVFVSAHQFHSLCVNIDCFLFDPKRMSIERHVNRTVGKRMKEQPSFHHGAVNGHINVNRGRKFHGTEFVIHGLGFCVIQIAN